jgi:hypothetical protein
VTSCDRIDGSCERRSWTLGRRTELASVSHPSGWIVRRRKPLSDSKMERIFEAETREEANRKADEWWATAKEVRFIHRSQTPAGFRSNRSNQWIIAIHYREEATQS